MSVGSFIGTREQPEIAYTEGKLEASDTKLIEWSPSKIDLVKRGERKCMNSQEAKVIPSNMYPGSALDATLAVDQVRTSFLAVGTISAMKFQMSTLSFELRELTRYGK